MKSKILNTGSIPEKKPTVYLNDGQGRDTYISFNNGGNFAQEFRFLVSPQQPTSLRLKFNYSVQQQYSTPRINYQGDGTGRDTYILQNIKDKYSSGQANYKSMLRSETNFGSFQKNRLQLPPLAKQKLNMIYQLQKVQSSRLSMPKNKLLYNEE
ncbi:unnamed protein product [Paramecium primaurelia]|uniref:Uncharacterized protein n=2 Tax=Paramecium TaxID=5884 RepID=A0A8S1UDV5_9CILI|nr:unnamed protein product [Paramecium primaurelia]CAD8163088.1 unnamed protein product [Paramecium pentaurelia]